ncbi:MAG: hypothetical protein QME55_08205 [Brevundimonas sp.]|uniref:hypothetical protein n=1 Tax=Brevundimonas sp. TaxID=1871086 RepID=UPI0026088EB3|nr:hypothetical protein [Brevundimonas sp.]MDI6624698.1 hypothetical protein [Brevundimonas sp.]
MAAAVLVVSFAFWKGDEPERIGAAAYALVFLGALMTPDSGNLSVPQWSLMAMDVVLLAVFLGLALHSRRSWLVWASAFQALIVTGHVLVAAHLRPPSNAFATVINMSNYGLLIAMAVGTFWAWQERRIAAMGSDNRAGPPRL